MRSPTCKVYKWWRKRQDKTAMVEEQDIVFDMEPFTLTLANGATLTGLANLPAVTSTTAKYRPLMVGLHGASYYSAYFDVDEKHTAALSSNGLGIPFVAVDRPGYKTSTAFTIPEGSSYPETYGAWLHEFILPAVWEKFGVPQGCNGIVLLAHSLGVSGVVLAAAKSGQEQGEASVGATPTDAVPPRPKKTSYPLAGIIISGLGIHPTDVGSGPLTDNPPEYILFPAHVKDEMYIPKGTCDPAVYAHSERLNLPVPSREVKDIWTAWLPRIGTEWAPCVRVPVLIALAGKDVYWQSTVEHAREFAAMFTQSSRAEWCILGGAPHNLELSYWSQGWYARCFGFGMECVASLSAV